MTLYTAFRGLFLWRVKLPGPDGKHNVWHRLVAEAAERAMKRWVRVVNADSIFPICAEVKFPSWRVPMISRLGDRLLHVLVVDTAARGRLCRDWGVDEGFGADVLRHEIGTQRRARGPSRGLCRAISTIGSAALSSFS